MGTGVRIHQWVEGIEKVEESQHQEQVEGVIVEDRERGSLSICHFILLPRYTVPGEKVTRCKVVNVAFDIPFIFFSFSELLARA